MFKLLGSVALSVALSVSAILALDIHTSIPSTSVLRQSSYMLTGENGSCSGVMIEPHRMLTAAHCDHVGYGKTVDGKPASVIKIDEVSDLMLLNVAPGCPCVPVSDSPIVRGDTLVAVGYPFGTDLLVQFMTSGTVQGMIHNPQSSFNVNGFIVSTVHVWPGSSGGGIFKLVDGEWRIVSIVSRATDGMLISPNSSMVSSFVR